MSTEYPRQLPTGKRKLAPREELPDVDDTRRMIQFRKELDLPSTIVNTAAVNNRRRRDFVRKSD